MKKLTGLFVITFCICISSFSHEKHFFLCILLWFRCPLASTTLLERVKKGHTNFKFQLCMKMNESVSSWCSLFLWCFMLRTLLSCKHTLAKKDRVNVFGYLWCMNAIGKVWVIVLSITFNQSNLSCGKEALQSLWGAVKFMFACHITADEALPSLTRTFVSVSCDKTTSCSQPPSYYGSQSLC